MWDLRTLKLDIALKGHSKKVTCLHNVSDSLFSGSEDSSVIVWSLLTGKSKKILNDHSGTINCVQLY